MRIIVPKGTPRTGAAANTSNNNNIPSANEHPRTPPFEQTYASAIPPSVTIPHTTSRNSYGARLSPPRDLGGYSHEPGEAPRRRKQTKKHKSTPSNTTASYYNNADLDDGYNSSDEHGAKVQTPATSCGQGLIQEIENDALFEEELKVKKGYYMKRTKEDGNCLFRAIADQIYGDEEMHGSVRKLCMDYMEKERDHFSQFVTEDFSSYVARKREDKCFGNNIEMQAISEVYCRPLEVYHGRSLAPLNIFHGTYNTDYPPIRLSYHHGNHYNSIVDPNNPSVGVGLGLPAYKPGLADKMQVMEALRLSEQDDIEKALIETSRQSSEYQEIEREIEEAVLAASRAEYIASLFANVPIPPSVSNSFPTTTTTSSPLRSPPTTTTTTTSTSSPPNTTTSTSSPPNTTTSTSSLLNTTTTTTSSPRSPTTTTTTTTTSNTNSFSINGP